MELISFGAPVQHWIPFAICPVTFHHNFSSEPTCKVETVTSAWCLSTIVHYLVRGSALLEYVYCSINLYQDGGLPILPARQLQIWWYALLLCELTAQSTINPVCLLIRHTDTCKNEHPGAQNNRNTGFVSQNRFSAFQSRASGAGKDSEQIPSLSFSLTRYFSLYDPTARASPTRSLP